MERRSSLAVKGSSLISQIPLKLEVFEPHSLRYLVPHSGVADALPIFERCLADLENDSNVFRSIFLYGPQGSGKTHLTRGYQELALTRGIQSVSVFDTDLLVTPETVRSFIDATEQARNSGGLIIAEGRELPTERGDLTPHITSRLLAGYSVRIGYPMEEELKPLLLSILERRSLRLPEHSVQHLLKLLPTNPLSMERIIRAIDELALSEQRKVGRGLILKALERASGA